MPSNRLQRIKPLLSLLVFLRRLISLPSLLATSAFREVVVKLLANPHVAELLRFIFLGTVVETSRQLGQRAVDTVKHFFVVRASFSRGDFAYDWVKRYLEDRHVWDQSRIFRVTACNPKRIGLRVDLKTGQGSSGTYEKSRLTSSGAERGGGDGDGDGDDDDVGDGRPQPIYQPAPKEPELFRWRNHWITVNMNMEMGDDGPGAQVLTLSVYSRNRKILDDFVQEARAHYFKSPLPPRELYSLPDMSGALLTARFNQGDVSYDWMAAFVAAQDEYEDITDIQVTTKQSDLIQAATSDDTRPLAAFKPAPRVKQRLRWRDHWIQFDVEPSSSNYDGRSYGGSVTVTLHNSKRSVLMELVLAAREEYLKSTVSKVTVHLSDRYGSWVKTVTKSRRALNTLILPEGVKEMLLADAREFLDSEEWYTWAGVPHRRGYLLYGEPGTGKSSTIHALASELNLEIYYVQLASQGMDDHNLSRLIADTPSRCILLLEDIDCAFPSREDDDDEEPQVDQFGNPIYSSGYQPHSQVTLSGLLNVLDSVTSEEGRIVFATTNHIERLDPALIRAGRMDVKVEYKLATKFQIQQTFLRFFEHRFVPSIVSNAVKAANPNKPEAAPSTEKLDPEDDSKPKQHALPSTTTTTTHESITISLPTPPSSALRTIANLSSTEIHALAEQFASQVPEGAFSLAQIQGYMLMKKADPRGAVEDAAEWVAKQMEERRKLEELKAKRKQKAKERAEAARKRAAEMAAKVKAEGGGDAGSGSGKSEKEEEGEKEEESGKGGEGEDAKETVTNGVLVNGVKSSRAGSVAETYATAVEANTSEDESTAAA